jgi:hypothetical protein
MTSKLPRVHLSDVLNREWWRRQDDEWTVEIDKPSRRSVQEWWSDVNSAFLQGHGEPDGPETQMEERLWSSELDLEVREFRVWDFDYYLLILQLTEDSTVLAEKRVPGWGVAPGRP